MEIWSNEGSCLILLQILHGRGQNSNITAGTLSSSQPEKSSSLVLRALWVALWRFHTCFQFKKECIKSVSNLFQTLFLQDVHFQALLAAGPSPSPAQRRHYKWAPVLNLLLNLKIYLGFTFCLTVNSVPRTSEIKLIDIHAYIFFRLLKQQTHISTFAPPVNLSPFSLLIVSFTQQGHIHVFSLCSALSSESEQNLTQCTYLGIFCLLEEQNHYITGVHVDLFWT